MRAKLITALAGAVVFAGLGFAWLGSSAAATGATASNAAPIASELTGMALVDELGLRQIPSSGTSATTDCRFATEVSEGAAYCLDPVAQDWSSARLVAAQIHGVDISPEMVTAVEAQAQMITSEEEYNSAIATGDPHASALLGRYAEARQSYLDAATQWAASQQG